MALTSQQRLIAIIVAVTVLVFGGLVFALLKIPSGGPNPVGKVVFNDTNAPVKGKEDSSVVVRFYSDFQCPACKATEPLLKAVEQLYQDRVKFIWKDFPLMTIHPNARPAANAARCAQAQGKFWEYHDKLYSAQEGWAAERTPKDRFVQFARELGLNELDFAKCYDARQFDGRVMDDSKEGEANRVDSTPSFFINDAAAFPRNEAEWRQVLDKALETASTSTVSPTNP